MIWLAWACLVGAAFLFDHVVLGRRHAAFSRTLGDRAIVTGYSVIWPSGHVNESRKAFDRDYRCQGGDERGYGVARWDVEAGPVAEFGIAILVNHNLDLALAGLAERCGQVQFGG